MFYITYFERVIKNRTFANEVTTKITTKNDITSIVCLVRGEELSVTTKRLHDSKIKNRVFNIGDRVLLFNSRLKIFSGKLKSRWNGPFTITRVFPYGTVELSQANGPNFKVNGHRVKHYFGGNVPHLDCPDCEDSQFCHSSRVSHPQLHLGIRYPNLID
ncbi:hypothetical protein Tco_0443161 [Tanacetum coccineum]